MFGPNFQRKYALSDQGIANTKKGTLWTVIVNLVVMGGMGILYFLMMGFMETLVNGAPLPSVLVFIGATVAFLILSLVTHYQQYVAMYGLVYDEVKTMRIGLAERLRKLPLGYFGKRDLADLTETIMGDVNRMEHVWSHVLGYLYGGYISTVIIAVMLFAMDWRLALASLWGVPVAFALLFGSRRMAERNAEVSKAASLAVADGMQEVLENIREIHATNQEQRYLDDLNAKIDESERVKVKSEFATGLFVNGASVIMRLGVATTILVGANLILSGQVDFMMLFMFLLVITRVYAPFDPEVLLGDYSMVFQNVVLFDDTVMENIRLGKHGATDEEVRAAAAAANCDEFVDKLPQGYGTPIGENGAKLSGGERQRISIARALLKDAPIVLLDEATASLDVENETKVQGALSRLLTGKTVLVIAHRMRTVETADKIVVLSDGTVAEEGTPADLLARGGGLFARMASFQAASAGWSVGCDGGRG